MLLHLGAGTTLEIVDLISVDGKEVDEVKFHWFTEPRTVSAAYRYARIMLRYGSFYEKKYGSFANDLPITGKICVLEYIEELKREGEEGGHLRPFSMPSTGSVSSWAMSARE